MIGGSDTDAMPCSCILNVATGSEYFKNLTFDKIHAAIDWGEVKQIRSIHHLHATTQMLTVPVRAMIRRGTRLRQTSSIPLRRWLTSGQHRDN